MNEKDQILNNLKNLAKEEIDEYHFYSAIEIIKAIILIENSK